MEEAPGAAAEGSGVEFGSAEWDIVRVPSHLAMEAAEMETGGGNEESVPLEHQGEMFPPAEAGPAGATEQLVSSAQEKSPETFLDKVELDSRPPEPGAMEQPVTDRGSASRAAEEHETSGRSEETVEETELVVLDPEHPLMRRFQAALKDYLTKQIEEANADVRELRTATKKRREQWKELKGALHGAQQQLAQLQTDLHKSHERCSQVAAERRQAEEELEGVRLTYKKTWQDADDERKKVAAMQTQLENLNLRLFYAQNMYEERCHNILLMKLSARKAEAEKVQAEMEKKKQDLLVDFLTRRAYELQEQIALFEAQRVAQAEDTKVIRQAVNEARMEMQAVNVEKKRLMNNWSSTLVALKQRDEAYIASQELLSKYRDDLKTLETDINACNKSIRKEEEKNEQLVTMLSRSQNNAKTTKKLIAQCLSRQEALKAESSTYARVLHETEQALNRTKMDQAACLRELLLVRKDVQRATDAKKLLENEIMEKIQEHMMSSKAANHFSQLAAKLHRRKMDLEMDFSKVENDIAQVVLKTTHTKGRVTILQKTLCELDKEIKNVCDLISCRESEIAKYHLLSEKKQVVMIQYNKRLEKLLSQLGGKELGPLEIEANKLTKQIEERNSELMMLQKSWLNLQEELVKLTQEREEQLASLDMLKKQLTVMQQKKVRTENEIQQETKEQKDLERHMRHMSNEVIKLNVLINKKNNSFEELQSGNIITENEFVRSLKAAEKEFLELQEKHSQLTEEKERLCSSLVEAEQQIMLWEKKIQLTKEMRAAVDSERGEGEIQAMRREIHRMKVRYGQLMKQQEKLIRDMEASVSHRENIAIRGEAQNKIDKKRISKSNFHHKKRELRKKISKTQKKIEDCDKTILELEGTQAALRASLLAKQQELCRRQAESNGLDWQIEFLQNTKRWNLMEIVSYQSRLKRLQALKEGRYLPSLCPTEQAQRDELQKLQDRLRTIDTIVQRVQQEHPQHQRTLQFIRHCLRSKLSSLEA